MKGNAMSPNTVETLSPRSLLDVLIQAGLIAVLAVFCYGVFHPFRDLMLWSMILAVTLYPLHTRLRHRLGSDGRAALRLDCNRANGPWSAKATSQDSGTFTFGNLAMTRALCPPPSLDQQIARDATYVRSYLLRSGNLYLNLMADGGTYVWSPDAGTAK